MRSKDKGLTEEKRCPVCGTVMQLDSNLEDGKNFSKCLNCGLVKNERYEAERYSDKYFTEDYRKQYGKTYSEDFSSIYKDSLRRLKKIRILLDSDNMNKSKFSLLDVGCAMGFFLKAAADYGAECLKGVEISKYAASYVSRNYGFDVYCGTFDNYIESEKYDVVSFWYFLEHNPDPVSTFKKLADMVNIRGVISFSVPSVYGPVYRKNRSEWYRLHPKDHALDFTPKSLKIMLKQNGFRNIVIIPASFHPERYFKNFKGKNFFIKLSAFFYRSIAKRIGFGDTLEVYAVKNGK